MRENVGLMPAVSVFVAARNEENNLEACLQALAKQNYEGLWEVLIADDHSTDATATIAKHFCLANPRFKYYKVPDATGETKGKALALAILAKEACGDLFLICDADMQMPNGWISAMVNAMQTHEVHMVNGTTTTLGTNWFTAIQAIDWLAPQATFAWLSRFGIAYTAMGNNMGITRKAYEATGGYFKIPFSLTEDFELFKQASQLGYSLIHLYHRNVLGISAPQKTISGWLEQHVRWMIGFSQLPLKQRFIFYLQLIFYPIWIFCLVMAFKIPALFLSSVFFLKLLYEIGLVVWLRLWKVLPFLVIYEVAWWPAYLWCWIRFSFSRTILWKGRTWEKS